MMPSRRVSADGARKSRPVLRWTERAGRVGQNPALEGRILMGLGVLFWLLALATAVLLIPPGYTVRELGFGFNGYIVSMLDSHRFCGGSVDLTGPLLCDHASRMPMLVWIVTLLAHVSREQIVIAVVKILVMAPLVLLALRALWRAHRETTTFAFHGWLVLALVLVLSPTIAKHLGQIAYEEGYYIPWLVMIGIGVPLLLGERALSPARFTSVALICLVCAVCSYLMKSALLPVGAVTAIVVFSTAVRRRNGLVALAALATATAPLGWGLFLQQATGRFSIMSSYDGENFLRGWNSMASAVYPRVHLDRLTDSRVIVTPDGERYTLTPFPGREAYPSEWAWNDASRAAGVAWIKMHPGEAAGFLLRKAANYFLSVVPTPRQDTAVPAPISRIDRLQRVIVTVWLVELRLLQLLTLAISVYLLARSPRDRLAVLAVAVLNAGFAAPFIIGFNYERHITAGATLMLGSLAVLLARALAMRTSESAPDVGARPAVRAPS